MWIVWETLIRLPGIRKLAVIPRNGNVSDAVVFDSVNQEVIMVGQGSFKASVIKQIIFNEDGKLSVKFTKGMIKQMGILQYTWSILNHMHTLLSISIKIILMWTGIFSMIIFLKYMD